MTLVLIATKPISDAVINISEPHGFERNELTLDQGSDMDGAGDEIIFKLLSRCLCRI